jgi:hypothetical protein
LPLGGQAIDVERVEDPPTALGPGVFLSRTLATVLAVGVILALALAFAAGILAGRFL